MSTVGRHHDGTWTYREAAAEAGVQEASVRCPSGCCCFLKVFGSLGSTSLAWMKVPVGAH